MKKIGIILCAMCTIAFSASRSYAQTATDEATHLTIIEKGDSATVETGLDKAITVVNTTEQVVEVVLGDTVPVFNDAGEVLQTSTVVVKAVPDKGSPWTEWFSWGKYLLLVLIGIVSFVLGQIRGKKKAAGG